MLVNPIALYTIDIPDIWADLKVPTNDVPKLIPRMSFNMTFASGELYERVVELVEEIVAQNKNDVLAEKCRVAEIARENVDGPIIVAKVMVDPHYSIIDTLWTFLSYVEDICTELLAENPDDRFYTDHKFKNVFVTTRTMSEQEALLEKRVQKFFKQLEGGIRAVVAEFSGVQPTWEEMFISLNSRGVLDESAMHWWYSMAQQWQSLRNQGASPSAFASVPEWKPELRPRVNKDGQIN